MAKLHTHMCALSQHVIRGNRPIKTEMAHQLYVLQVLTFNLLEERMMTKMDPNDQVRLQMFTCQKGDLLCLLCLLLCPSASCARLPPLLSDTTS